MIAPDALVGTAVGLATLAGTGYGLWRKGRGRREARRVQQEAERQRQRDIADVILGRAAEPDNDITGEPGRPELPTIVQRIEEVGERQLASDQKLEYVIAQQHAMAQQQAQMDRIEQRQVADGIRMDRMADQIQATTTELHEVKASLVDTVHNAAEASRTVLSTIDTALHSRPPKSDHPPPVPVEPPPDVD